MKENLRANPPSTTKESLKQGTVQAPMMLLTPLTRVAIDITSGIDSEVHEIVAALWLSALPMGV